ncbi:unnamed protein product [Danaus chrysippus]|uniref:(African queen) hypothetical protein n=1 Tax=Danaus chrysippus TaxID=151541 RepID=A0A8J2QBV5_9NEOP|nr:unnamed protein product [Danaus chrysippus]
MDSLTVSPILQYNTDALQYIRRQYNLDQPERIQEAVNILSDWINKQDHLVKKNYGSDYLERILINCKGSVEKAKTKLDKICSFRTALPIYFEPFDINHPAVNKIVDGFLPKMTPDHCRVFLLRNNLQKFDFVLLNCYRALIAEGYGMRIKSIHIITTSNLIDMVVSIIKQGMSEKLGQRIHVHKSLDSIYNFVPKDIMPEDYGGSEKTLQQLHATPQPPSWLVTHLEAADRVTCLGVPALSENPGQGSEDRNSSDQSFNSPRPNTTVEERVAFLAFITVETISLSPTETYTIMGVLDTPDAPLDRCLLVMTRLDQRWSCVITFVKFDVSGIFPCVTFQKEKGAPPVESMFGSPPYCKAIMRQHGDPSQNFFTKKG